VRRHVVQEEVDVGDAWSVPSIEVGEEGEELGRPFAPVPLADHAAGAGVEGGKEVERPVAPMLVVDLDRAPRLGRTGRGRADAGLERGLLVRREHHLVRGERAGQEQTERGDAGEEGGVARHRGVPPEVMPPGFEVVAAPDAAHRLARDAGHHPVRDQLAGQLDAVPLRQRAPLLIRQGAGERDGVDRHQRGGKPAAGRRGADP
jgi:hypothetical protein